MNARSVLCAGLLLVPGLAAAQVDTPEAQALLRDAIAEAHRSVGCTVYYTNDAATDMFYARMDALAEEKFRAAGLEFPATMDERDAAFLPVYADLVAQGLIIDERDGDIERFPSACKD